MKINDFFEGSRFVGVPLQIKRIMKLTILIMTIFLMQVSASTKAQITLNENKISLQKALEAIGAQSGYDFIYSIQDFKNSKPITVKLVNVSVDKALQVCFADQPLIYEITDKTVVVRKREDKSVIDRVKDYFTRKDIRGKVVDEEGNALQGASVKVKGTKQIVVTDQYGLFALKDIKDEDFITISYIGYEPIELNSKAFGDQRILLTLIRSESKLDEVQVMAYGITTRRISTGNIATLKLEDIEKQQVSNPLLALQGRVAGLIITPSSGIPGSPVSVQLRGVNTLGNLAGVNKTAEPLFVIDGIPYANNIPGGSRGPTPVNGQMSAFSFINPSDVESIDILKDADATAIYGSRGANGVILITTRKAKIGSNNINVNLSSGIGEVPKKLDLLNTQQYLEMRKEAFKNDGLNVPTVPSASNYDLTLWDQNRYTDWQDQLLGGTAKYYNAMASISGGTPSVQYLITGNYNQQGYVFPGDAKNESGHGHFSITGSSFNNKFRATLTGSYMANKNNAAVDFTNMAMILAPNAPAIYKADGSLNWEPNPNNGFGTWTNPYSRMLNSVITKNNMINSSADLSYRVLPSLTIKTNIGFSELRGNIFAPRPLAANDPAVLAPLYGTKASSSTTTNSSRSWSVEPQALYNTMIGQGRLDAIVGATTQYQTIGLEELTAFGYTSDALLKNLSSAASYTARNTSSQYKYKGVFGRVTYNWTDKYILNLNLRRDGSSRFGPKQQYGNFGSVGAAWIFTNETFFQRAVPFISFGKLRFSYGTSGNDGIDNYKYLELYENILGNPTYQGGQGLASLGVTNPYYHWEKTTKVEVGLESGLLKDRIVFSVAYFRNRSSDQLGAFEIPATAGTNGNFVVNQNAKIQNSGLEFMLNTQNFKSKKFIWSTALNLSIPRNKLLALPDGGSQAYGLDGFVKVGDPYYGTAYVYLYKGVDPATGKYQFLGNDGNLTTTNPGAGLAREVTTPKFYGGLSNSFSYKGFTLDVFLQFSKRIGQNYLYDPVLAFRNPGSFSVNRANMPVEVLERWRNSGDISNIQRFTTRISGDVNNSSALASMSTAAYVDASFIRVKNASLSYNIRELWKQKLGMKSLRVYLLGQNLWTITDYKGLDPETQTIGRLPQLRMLTAGIQAGF